MHSNKISPDIANIKFNINRSESYSIGLTDRRVVYQITINGTDKEVPSMQIIDVICFNIQ